MSRTFSRILTATFLVGAVVLIGVAVHLHRQGAKAGGGDAAAPAPYRVLPAPFPAGAIEGRVLVTGSSQAAAETAAPALPEEPPGCAPQPMVAGTGGGLAETVVALRHVRAGIAPSTAGPSLSLGRCGFEPRVVVGLEGTTASVGVPAGEHRLQATLGEVRLFDAVAAGTARIALVGAGTWTVRCATNHPWEQAWIFVSKNPYATVTDAHGRFRLADVPAGDYEIEAWNPRWGARKGEVLVETNRTAKVELQY